LLRAQCDAADKPDRDGLTEMLKRLLEAPGPTEVEVVLDDKERYVVAIRSAQRKPADPAAA
jgi:hypothetical protein